MIFVHVNNCLSTLLLFIDRDLCLCMCLNVLVDQVFVDHCKCFHTNIEVLFIISCFYHLYIFGPLVCFQQHMFEHFDVFPLNHCCLIFEDKL